MIFQIKQWGKCIDVTFISEAQKGALLKDILDIAAEYPAMNERMNGYLVRLITF